MPRAAWETSDWTLDLPATVGVISDTHLGGPNVTLPPPVLQALDGLPLILHAGDICDFALIEALGKLAPVESVHGNMDPAPLRRRLPDHRLLRLGAFRVGLTHGEGGPTDAPNLALDVFRRADPPVDAVVFGHSHRALCETRAGVLLLNPGSPSRPLSGPPSYGLLHLGDTIRGEIVCF